MGVIRFHTPEQFNEESFWKRVDRRGEDDCWLWTGGQSTVNGMGTYGRFNLPTCLGRGSEYAHRYAYMITKGEIPDGLFVCHECDTKLCCNPKHLHLGTPKENTHEAMQRGLWPEWIGQRSLSDRDEEKLYWMVQNEGVSMRAVAERFGVCRQTGYNIVKRVEKRLEIAC